MPAYLDARNLAQLAALGAIYPALLAMGFHLAPDQLAGQPVMRDLVVPGVMLALGGPALGATMYAGLRRLAPAGRKGVYAGLAALFGGAPTLLGLAILAAWQRTGNGPADGWLYLTCAAMALAYAAALAAAVAAGRRGAGMQGA